MKDNNNKVFKRWLLMLTASFMMYEVLWSVIELQFEDVSFQVDEVAWDFAQCMLFTSVVFTFNWFFAKWRGGRYAGGVVELAAVLVVNAFVIFVTDRLLNERDADDIDFWGVIDIYVICIICSLLSIIDIQRAHHKQIMAMRQEQMRLRLTLLQQQLSPHFMFNSLSTLQGMIAADPQMAEDYVAALSDIMRYITENIGKEKVSLTDAMAFIKSYAKMLEARFPGHFVFNITDLDKPRPVSIVPVSLQMTVENAIKHNSHSVSRPLEISVTPTDNTVVVKNTKQPTAYNSGLGIGLNNLNERYKLLIGRELDISETKDYYIVKIPLIHESVNS